MAGRKRRTDSVLPLHGKVQTTHVCAEGRSRLTGLLSRRNTASHRCHLPAYPREVCWPGHRALPLCPLPAGPGRRYGFSLLPVKRVKKNSGYPWVSTVKVPYELPPVALPTSGKRVEAFASSQPAGSPVFCPIMAPEHRAVKAVFQRDGLDKRKAAAYTVPRKGVLGRGLRGGCIPSTSPDLGNANVGMRRKSDIFPRPAHLPQTCG